MAAPVIADLLSGDVGEYIRVDIDANPEPGSPAPTLDAVKRAWFNTLEGPIAMDPTDVSHLLPIGTRITLTSTSPTFTLSIPKDADHTANKVTTGLTTTTIFDVLATFRDTYQA